MSYTNICIDILVCIRVPVYMHICISYDSGRSRAQLCMHFYPEKEVSSHYLAPHWGRARYCNAHVCLCVCVFVCLCVCPCFRKISKCNISVISQPIIMKFDMHIPV